MSPEDLLKTPSEKILQPSLRGFKYFYYYMINQSYTPHANQSIKFVGFHRYSYAVWCVGGYGPLTPKNLGSEREALPLFSARTSSPGSNLGCSEKTNYYGDFERVKPVWHWRKLSLIPAE